MRMLVRLLCVGMLMGAMLVPAGPALAGGFCSGYDGERPTAARGTKVSMAKSCFSPTVLHVEAGQTVIFKNDDHVAHTAGGAAGSFGNVHSEIAAGDSVAYTFEDDGVYPYVCLIHPGMAGAIVIGDGVATPLRAVGSVLPGSEDVAEETGAASADAAEETGGAAATAETEASPSRSSISTGTVLALAFLVVLAAAVTRAILLAYRRSGNEAAREV